MAKEEDEGSLAEGPTSVQGSGSRAGGRAIWKTSLLFEVMVYLVIVKLTFSGLHNIVWGM